ncbi:MAG: thioredoxin domain-containing protein [Trueperaceae bacterium]|nr:thioredoxin domain-containing protein [Trueperaceae bacterium]
MRTRPRHARPLFARFAATWLVAVLLAGLASGAALGQSIGDPATAFLDASGAVHEGEGRYRIGSWAVRPYARDELLVRTELEGTLDEEGIEDAAQALAIATGYGAGIEDGIAQFLSQRAGELAGRGQVEVSVEAYRLGIEVRGDAPYEATLTLARPAVPPEAFPEPVATLGPEDAPVVVREFSDFQCPFCQRYAREVLPGLKDELVASGEVRFAFHHFPLDSIHANASPAAEAAQCVADAFGPGAFWAYHDLLFERQAAWQDLGDPDAYFARLVRDMEASLPSGRSAEEARQEVATCLEEGRTREAVAAAYDAATRLGLSGTPSVFVGRFRLNEFGDPTAYGRLVRLERAYAATDQARPVEPAATSEGGE